MKHPLEEIEGNPTYEELVVKVQMLTNDLAASEIRTQNLRNELEKRDHEKVKKLVREHLGRSCTVVKVIPGGMDIVIEHPPGVSYALLVALSEHYKTKSINLVTESSSGGCETCDYGGYEELTIEIRGIKR